MRASLSAPKQAPAPDDEHERTVTVLDETSTGSTDGHAGPRIGLEVQSGAGRDHRCVAGVDGGDELGVVDSLQIDRGDTEIGMPQLALDDVERDASWASSMAWA
jgi:hypothetical protein